MEKMKEGLNELKLLSISVSSPNMDGMPKSHGVSDKYAQTLARIDKREREIAAQSKQISRMKTRARRAVGRLAGAFKAFCEAYYMDGVPFVIAQAESGVTERQCKRYMREISTGVK